MGNNSYTNDGDHNCHYAVMKTTAKMIRTIDDSHNSRKSEMAPIMIIMTTVTASTNTT